MVLLDGLGPSAGIFGGMSNLTCFCPGGAGGVSPGGASCGGAFFAGAAGLGAGITCVASFRRIAFSSSADSGPRTGGVFLVLPRLLLALLLLVVLIRLSEKRRCFFRRSPQSITSIGWTAPAPSAPPSLPCVHTCRNWQRSISLVPSKCQAIPCCREESSTWPPVPAALSQPFGSNGRAPQRQKPLRATLDRLERARRDGHAIHP